MCQSFVFHRMMLYTNINNVGINVILLLLFHGWGEMTSFTIDRIRNKSMCTLSLLYRSPWTHPGSCKEKKKNLVVLKLIPVTCLYYHGWSQHFNSSFKQGSSLSFTQKIYLFFRTKKKTLYFIKYDFHLNYFSTEHVSSFFFFFYPSEPICNITSYTQRLLTISCFQSLLFKSKFYRGHLKQQHNRSFHLIKTPKGILFMIEFNQVDKLKMKHIVYSLSFKKCFFFFFFVASVLNMEFSFWRNLMWKGKQMLFERVSFLDLKQSRTCILLWLLP